MFLGPPVFGGPYGPLLVTTGFSPVPLVWSHVTPLYRLSGFAAETFPFTYMNIRCVERYANAVAGRIADMHARTGRRVKVLGLSMGGVAALYAMKRLGAAAHAEGMVALGAPFYGSPIAPFGRLSLVFSRVGRQLTPGSRFLAELHADPLPPGIPVVSVGGSKDRICPVPTTRLDGARHLAREFAHLELLTSVALHTETVAVLRELSHAQESHVPPP